MMRWAFLAGVVVALALAVFCEWIRAVSTVNEWAAGPGECRFVGPETGQCQCSLFVRSGGYDGMCGTCSHPRWTHAGV